MEPRSLIRPRHWARAAKAGLSHWWTRSPDETRGNPHALSIERVNGTTIIVLPQVFNGVQFHTGAFLAETLTAELVPSDASVLDLGTGSGIGSIFAARWAARVVATDINPEAARCARINALAHHLENTVETRIGDLFEPVRGERFDLILFNPPYYRGVPHDFADHALRSPDAFDRFLLALPEHLTARGRALVVLSPDTDIEGALWAAPHLSVTVRNARQVLDKTLRVYDVRVKRGIDDR
jgi:SAM-dependent methyltransferase